MGLKNILGLTWGGVKVIINRYKKLLPLHMEGGDFVFCPYFQVIHWQWTCLGFRAPEICSGAPPGAAAGRNREPPAGEGEEGSGGGGNKATSARNGGGAPRTILIWIFILGKVIPSSNGQGVFFVLLCGVCAKQNSDTVPDRTELLAGCLWWLWATRNLSTT